MNARQKAKRLKRELDFLKKQPIKPIIYTRPVETVMVRHKYPISESHLESLDIDWILKQDIPAFFSRELWKYIEVTKREYNKFTGYFEVEANLQVVNRNREW